MSGNVLGNLQRKAEAADRMFTALVDHMRDAVHVRTTPYIHEAPRVPEWLIPVSA